MHTYVWQGPPNFTLVHPSDGRPIPLIEGAEVEFPDGIGLSPELWAKKTASKRREENSK